MASNEGISHLYSKMREEAVRVASEIERRLELEPDETYEHVHRAALVTELYAFQLIMLQVLAKECLESERLGEFLSVVDEGGGISGLVDVLHPDQSQDASGKARVNQDLELAVSQAVQKYKPATHLDPRVSVGDMFAQEPLSARGRFCKAVAEAIGEENNPEYRAMAAVTMSLGVAREDIIRAAQSL